MKNMYEKKFEEWLRLKEKLHEKTHSPQFVKEGDIWWVAMGVNIGREIDGKSHVFTRPVVILKRLAHGFYFVVPVTTQLKEGSWFVSFKLKNKQMVACLNQARAMDYRRLFSKRGVLGDCEFGKVRMGFANLYL